MNAGCRAIRYGWYRERVGHEYVAFIIAPAGLFSDLKGGPARDTGSGHGDFFVRTFAQFVGSDDNHTINSDKAQDMFERGYLIWKGTGNSAQSCGCADRNFCRALRATILLGRPGSVWLLSLDVLKGVTADIRHRRRIGYLGTRFWVF